MLTQRLIIQNKNLNDLDLNLNLNLKNQPSTLRDRQAITAAVSSKQSAKKQAESKIISIHTAHMQNKALKTSVHVRVHSMYMNYTIMCIATCMYIHNVRPV
jgi:hypothetical protein